MMADMTEPTFDADGYPTDETLERIATWPLPTPDSAGELLDFCRRAWDSTYGSWETDTLDGSRRHTLATGGWSGNESVADAMERNTMFWLLCWRSFKRGGRYEYREG